MNWTNTKRSANVVDRRADNRPVAPSAPDTLVRGLPQTPVEMAMYKDAIAREEYYRQHGAPMPQPPPGTLHTEGYKPSEGDPAAIEDRRAQEALKRTQRARELFQKLSNRQ